MVGSRGGRKEREARRAVGLRVRMCELHIRLDAVTELASTGEASLARRDGVTGLKKFPQRDQYNCPVRAGNQDRRL